MTPRRAIVWTGGLAVLALPFLFWLVWLSPFLYEYPRDWRMPDTDVQHPVFVYGTLRSPAVRWLVLGRVGQPDQYTLPGYERQGLDLIRQPGARVEGLLLRVTARELKRLDRYERVGVRYERVRVRGPSGELVWLYQRL